MRNPQLVVTRAPLRLPLGGGGTDLPEYYSRYGGFLVSATINKFIYFVVHPHFDAGIRLHYSGAERVDRLDEIRHPLFREVLRFVGVEGGIEIASMADVPGNTGLGSSCSFLVGLLHALHRYRGEWVDPHRLAEEASYIGMEVLKEPIGLQDQYISAFGGVQTMEIDRSGRVTLSPLEGFDPERFEAYVRLYFTGIRRDASDILREQQKRIRDLSPEETERMHRIKAIGYAVRDALQAGDLETFGRLLHEHWMAKRGTTSRTTNEQIDRWYALAREAGALGGKIVGAGGGGFLLLCTPPERQEPVHRAMVGEGLRPLPFRIWPRGSEVLLEVGPEEEPPPLPL